MKHPLAFPVRRLHQSLLLSLTLLSVTTITVARAENSSRLVGAGLSYASPTQAPYVQPASLAELGGHASFEGLWRFGVDAPLLTIAGSAGSAGIAAGYSNDGGGTDTIFAGIGVKVGQNLMLGATLFNHDFENNLDADLGAVFQLQGLRLSFVARSVESQVNRLDASIGWALDALTFDFAVKRVLPWATHAYMFDASTAYNAGPIGFGLGYYFHRFGGTFDGDGLHASLAYNLGKVILEAHYKFLAQEIAADKWTVGARIDF